MTPPPSGGFYHEGMRELQDLWDGRRLADVLEAKIRHDTLEEGDRAKVEAAGFFFIASCWGDVPDCSVKAGDPGFVKVTGPATLEFPDYDGNSMYRTLGNVARNPNVSLLFADFDGRSYRLRINGRARLRRDPEALARHGGRAKAVVEVSCVDVFPNCPRYLPDLAGGRPSADVPRGAEPTPTPDWKRVPFVTPALPEGDPHRAGIAEEASGEGGTPPGARAP